MKLAATPSLCSSIVPVLMVTVTGRRFPLLGFGSPIPKVTGVAPATPLAVPRLSTRVPSVRLTSEKLPVSDSPATTSVRFAAPTVTVWAASSTSTVRVPLNVTPVIPTSENEPDALIT